MCNIGIIGRIDREVLIELQLALASHYVGVVVINPEYRDHIPLGVRCCGLSDISRINNVMRVQHINVVYVVEGLKIHDIPLVVFNTVNKDDILFGGISQIIRPAMVLEPIIAPKKKYYVRSH